jgi:hypothetical protein
MDYLKSDMAETKNLRSTITTITEMTNHSSVMACQLERKVDSHTQIFFQNTISKLWP